MVKRRFVIGLILVIVFIAGAVSIWQRDKAENDKYVYELARSASYLEQIIYYCEKNCEEPQEHEECLSEIVKNLGYLETSVSEIALLYGGKSGEISVSIYRFCDDLNGVCANENPSADHSYVEEINAASKEFLSGLTGGEGDVPIEDFVKVAEQYGNRLELIELPQL